MIALDLEEIDESAFWLEYITDEQIMKEKIVTPLFDESQEFNINLFGIKKDNEDEQLSIF